MTREDNAAAQALLEQAIAIDANYAQALAVFAVSRATGVHMCWEDAAIAIPAAERAGLAAIRADSDDPWAHVAVGLAQVCSRRFEDALATFELGMLNSNFALAQALYDLVLSSVERWREGGAAARRALRLSPRDPFSAICSAIAAYAEFAGCNYHESIRLGR